MKGKGFKASYLICKLIGMGEDWSERNIVSMKKVLSKSLHGRLLGFSLVCFAFVWCAFFFFFGVVVGLNGLDFKF